MTADIYKMPTPLDVLAKEISALIARDRQNRDDWIEITLALATRFADARKRFPSDNQFSHWIADHPELMNVTADDRAALINMMRDPTLTRTVLQETTRRSWRLIWLEEIEPRFRNAAKPTDPVPPPLETDPNTPIRPPASDSPSSEVAENPAPAQHDYGLVGSSNELMRNPDKAELVRMLGITADEYRECFSVYPWNRQRVLKKLFSTMAANKNKRRMAVDLFRHGLDIVRTGKAPKLSTTSAFDARVFAPDVPEAISKFWQFEQIAKRLDLVKLINAKMNDFRQLPPQQQHAEILHLWEHGTPLPPTQPRAVEIPPEDSKNRIRHPVKFCGETIWPNQSLRHVTYDDLNMGWHLAHHWLKYLEYAKPQKPNEILVLFGHLIQDLRAASSLQAVTDVMTSCMSAYARRNGRKDKGEFDEMMAPGAPR